MPTKKQLDGYYKLREEGWSYLMNSSLAYDKALITLSTLALGFIYAIINTSIFASLDPTGKSVLILILVLLLLCISISLLSFWFDQIYGQFLIKRAEEVYLKENDDYKNIRHWSLYATNASKIASGILFIFSLILFAILITTTHVNPPTNPDSSINNATHAVIPHNKPSNN